MDKYVKEYIINQQKSGLLAKGEDLKIYNNLIENLYNAKLSEDEIVDILRNVNAKLAKDVIFSYSLKCENENNGIQKKLSKIYLKELIEDYNKGCLEKRLTLRKTKKRSRVLTREEILFAMFEKGVNPMCIIIGYEGNDELEKTLVDIGKEVFRTRKTEAVYDRIENSLVEDMNYIIDEIEKFINKTL